MTDNKLDIFRVEYLNANSWAQRKEGVPLDLLDALTEAELQIAEVELIDSLSLTDDWPIRGVGYIKSKKALPKLYELLLHSKNGIKITIAHSIFQICADKEMIEIVLYETPKLSSVFEIINIIYLLPDFGDKKIDDMINDFRMHSDYLVAYNATRALGLSTDEVVKKFREKRDVSFLSKIKKMWTDLRIKTG